VVSLELDHKDIVFGKTSFFIYSLLMGN
jgi:hypothetical protein